MPEALPYPLNTTDDDLFFFPLCGQDAGYMTRFEPDGFGSGDIYRVELVPYEEMAEEIAQDSIELEEPVVQEPTHLPEPVPQPEEPQPVEPERPYRIAPIFFEFDSYALTEVAITKLDEISEVMQAFPEINIEIQGHTDSKGPDSYNQVLSERRAGTVKKYLVDKGVDTNRLTTKGFSESAPAAINTNPDGTDSFKGRKLNRRVEFKIDPGIIKNLEVEKVEVPEDLKID